MLRNRAKKSRGSSSHEVAESRCTSNADPDEDFGQGSIPGTSNTDAFEGAASDNDQVSEDAGGSDNDQGPGTSNTDAFEGASIAGTSNHDAFEAGTDNNLSRMQSMLNKSSFVLPAIGSRGEKQALKEAKKRVHSNKKFQEKWNEGYRPEDDESEKARSSSRPKRAASQLCAENIQVYSNFGVMIDHSQVYSAKEIYIFFKSYNFSHQGG